MTTNLTDYFLGLTGERSLRVIADRAGLEQSTVNRQLNGTNAIRVETVVAICRAYGLDMASTFVAVGFITADEVASFKTRFDLSQLSDLDLSKEMLRRVASGTASATITDPISDQIVNDVLREVAVELAHDNGER